MQLLFSKYWIFGTNSRRDGLQPDPKKIEKMKNLSSSQILTQLKAAVGLFSYYRKFVPQFAKIAKPMTELMTKRQEFKWNKEAQEAFERLKKIMIQAPILAYPNEEKEFILITDASETGLGAVLSQKDEKGREVVMEYTSRKLNKHEQKYPITEQECLAVKWAINYFHQYLIGKQFRVITDHSALKTLMITQVPKGRRARWIIDLDNYDFIIEHRAEKSNANADALSRLT